MEMISSRFNVCAAFHEMKQKRMIIIMMSIIIFISVLLNYFIFPYTSVRANHRFFTTFLFTFFQVYCVYFFILFFGTFDLPKLWQRIFTAFSSFILGAILGTALCFFVHLPFDEQFRSWEALYLSMAMDVLYNFIFGSMTCIYFYFDYKIQTLSKQLADKQLHEQKLIALKAKSEMETLRAKVNPHFLFNTLNSISSLVHSNPDLAEDMIQKLANLFRYSLDLGEEDFITLETELDIVKNYLEIEKVRLNSRLDYSFDIGPNSKTILLPPFLLQPLVENSIKHGITKHASGGMIKISAKIENGFCFLSVEDNGVGFQKNELKERFGLKGIRERLSLHFDKNFEFVITSENGTKTEIKIPIQHEKKI